MEAEWDWRNRREKVLENKTTQKCKKKIKNLNLKKKEGKSYELWRIWWTICTTRIKRKIK